MRDYYSSTVEIYLEVANTRLEVASYLGNSCVLKRPASLKSGMAEIILIVDKKEERRPIFITTEQAIASKTVEFAARARPLSVDGEGENLRHEANLDAVFGHAGI